MTYSPPGSASKGVNRGSGGADAADSVWTVGPWRVDAGTGELQRGTELERVEPKVAEVLVFLARRAGQVVSRDELLGAVWPGVVVGDDALTQAIIKLRKALGDDARRPAYIETLAKRGYRLIAPVAVVEEPGRGATGAAAGAASAAVGAEPAAGAVGAKATSDAGTAAASHTAAAPQAPETSSTPTAAAAPFPATFAPAAPTPLRAKPWRWAALAGGLAALAIAAGLGLGVHRHWPWPIGST
jgi:DNA-binding winged helix-turn-helix (wHTH) protein